MKSKCTAEQIRYVLQVERGTAVPKWLAAGLQEGESLAPEAAALLLCAPIQLQEQLFIAEEARIQ